MEEVVEIPEELVPAIAANATGVPPTVVPFVVPGACPQPWREVRAWQRSCTPADQRMG